MVFHKRFGIQTPIQYLEDVEVDKKCAARFERSWTRFFNKGEVIVSKTREDRCDAFFRQLERDGTDERYCRRVRIRFINPVVGYGVFAKEDIPPYSTLGQYTGILMLDDDVNPDHDSTFTFSDFKKYSIDAMNQGNWTRFMNHSSNESLSNNVEPWEHYMPEGPRIVFTSGSRGIKKGQQLLYSYGDDYWDSRKFKAL